METGTYILVLIFAFFTDADWADSRSAVASIDSQHFEGFKSLETCNAAAADIGPALISKYEGALGTRRLKVSYEHLCISNKGQAETQSKYLEENR